MMMMIAESQITQVLTDYIQTELNQKQMAITPKTALIEAGLIDSLGIFKLILFMEEHYSIKIQLEDIVAENFTTVLALTRLVQARQGLLDKAGH